MSFVSPIHKDFIQDQFIKGYTFFQNMLIGEQGSRDTVRDGDDKKEERGGQCNENEKRTGSLISDQFL